MGHVRPFVEEDIPKVSELHRRVFRTGDASSLELQRSYQSYFVEIYLRNPWRNPALPSLVYQDANGDVIGFLGVLPRSMAMKGRPVLAAVSSQFIVEPDRRSTLAALQLLKAFLAGPQELSIADEANDTSRKLWESFGGTTALLSSLYWIRLLRPTQFALSRLDTVPAAVRLASAPLCRLLDTLAVTLKRSPFQQCEPRLDAEELTPDALLACLSQLPNACSLRPQYDDESLRWLFHVLSDHRGDGILKKLLVRGAGEKIIGWYVYQLVPGAMGEVLQIGAEERSIKLVLDHLFFHARRDGATALSGRIEPRFVQQFREENSLFHHRGYWVLLHSNNPELLHALHKGDAFLSRLEGEWCMRFRRGGNGGELCRPVPQRPLLQTTYAHPS